MVNTSPQVALSAVAEK